jgi:PAS domain S-box-containing protein
MLPSPVDDDVLGALRDSEELYRTLFEQAPIGVFLFDRSLRVTEINHRMVELLQSSYEKIIGLDLNRIGETDLLRLLERVLEGEPGYYEGPYHAITSGAVLFISSRLSPLRDAEGNVVGGIGLTEDVTERTAAMTRLRLSEERLQLHVKHSPLAVVVVDRERRVIEWNAAATRIFGWSADEMLGQDALDRIVPPKERGRVEEIARKLLSRSGGRRSTNENVTKDGRTILCDWYNTTLVGANGEVHGFASLVADVTERRDAEEALKRSEARFRELIERIPEAIVVSREGRFVYVNPALLVYLGYESPVDLIGRSLTDVAHPDDRPTLLDRRSRIARGESPAAAELRLVRRDGAIVTAEVNSVRVEWDGVVSSVAVIRDVTERKQMQLRLLQADRMASVGTLAAGVAHEINNPLAYLMANLDVVAARKLPEILRRIDACKDRSPEEARVVSEEVAQALEMLEIAREGAARVRDIVRDLKTFSRTDDERRGPVDVRRVLDASINMAWNEIRHRARLVKDYGEVPPVHANESRLGQVFLNLLVNAAQALQVGGATENEIRVRVALDAGGRVAIEVSDTGPGIAHEILGRIFDPFFTTKPVGVGTGLGLWICQGIVTSLGGELAVHSERGRGATFTVSLEPHDYLAGVRGGGAHSIESRIQGRVLVIDDELAVGRVLRESLGDDHEVVVSTSGREALELLRRDPSFDVVLCDLMMPDVSGIEVYETLRDEKSPALDRFLFMTGGAFTSKAREFLDGVAEAPIDKPFDVDDLRRRILDKRARRLAARRRGHG